MQQQYDSEYNHLELVLTSMDTARSKVDPLSALWSLKISTVKHHSPVMRKGRVLWHARLTDRLPPLEISPCKGLKEKESGELGDRRVAKLIN